MIEKHEKAERMQIMCERGCSELEAAYLVAERLAAHEGGQDNENSTSIAARRE